MSDVGVVSATLRDVALQREIRSRRDNARLLRNKNCKLYSKQKDLWREKASIHLSRDGCLGQCSRANGAGVRDEKLKRPLVRQLARRHPALASRICLD